jgi:PAS domain-containing protein
VNERFRRLVEASPAAVVVLDAAGVVRLEPAAERIFGWPSAERSAGPTRSPTAGGPVVRAGRSAGETITGAEVRRVRKDGRRSTSATRPPRCWTPTAADRVVELAEDVTQDKRCGSGWPRPQRLESVGRLPGRGPTTSTHLLAVITGMPT